MKSTSLYKSPHREWFVLGRDPDKAEGLIDTNQYLVVSGNESILIEPGGVELFASMLTAVLRHVPLDSVRHLFSSHQDPDVVSALGLWDKALNGANLYAPWLWESFLRHYGMSKLAYCSIPDEGMKVVVGEAELHLIPAHYLHASGNFHVYDPEAKLLMTGDIGAALEPAGVPFFVTDFESHIPKMKAFHQRWMPSNRAKNDWVRRVRTLDIDMIVPQHGRILRDSAVHQFLDWFEALEVGTAVP